AVVGLISRNEESADGGNVLQLTDLCRAINLSMNVDETKEMFADISTAQTDHSLLSVDALPRGDCQEHQISLPPSGK
ncbi:hypothetical protein chiPu_0030153, partial [Chiloscyllium punctatum]|nr:hypothetical protein [Chiloscyllium punctatum]